jgi:4-amino-4-deoxy-L-arabinose transferase-like glycosyltransferase
MRAPPFPTRRAALAAFAVVALGGVGFFFADRYCAHGLDATWYYTRDGHRSPVTRSIEHRPAFGSVHRALSQYLQNWPFESWGVPAETPPIDAVFEGEIEIPEGPPRWLTADGNGNVVIEIDGQRAMVPVVAGRHRIAVHWTTTPDKASSMRLRWATVPGRDEGVPATALTPSSGAWPVERIALWIAGPLALLALALALFGSLVTRERSRRHARLRRLALVVIVLWGTGLRLWDYAAVPEFRENKDELYATWNGWSLLEDGTLRGWTSWPNAYAGTGARIERIAYFDTNPSAVVSPYFEHPPLLHVLAGAAAHASGAEHWSFARLKYTRLVPIALSVLTIVLVYAFARRLRPEGVVPLVASAMYALIPLIVLQNRAIKEEALIAPLVLGGLIFFLRWRDEGERMRDLVAASVLMGLCIFAKVPGFAFVLALGVLVAARGRYGAALLSLGIGGSFWLLFVVEGAIVDWDLFWWVQQYQATTRGSFWNIFLKFFHYPKVIHNVVGRGWLLFLWVAWAASVAGPRRRAEVLLTVPLIFHLVVIGISSGFWTFGWYWLPMFPFLCIAAAIFIIDLWNEPDLFRGFCFVGLFVFYFLNFVWHPGYVLNGISFDVVRPTVTGTTIAFLAPYVLVHLRRAPWTIALARLSTVAGLVVAVSLSSWFVYEYDRLVISHAYLDVMTSFDQ